MASFEEMLAEVAEGRHDVLQAIVRDEWFLPSIFEKHGVEGIQRLINSMIRGLRGEAGRVEEKQIGSDVSNPNDNWTLFQKFFDKAVGEILELEAEVNRGKTRPREEKVFFTGKHLSDIEELARNGQRGGERLLPVSTRQCAEKTFNVINEHFVPKELRML